MNTCLQPCSVMENILHTAGKEMRVVWHSQHPLPVAMTTMDCGLFYIPHIALIQHLGESGHASWPVLHTHSKPHEPPVSRHPSLQTSSQHCSVNVAAAQHHNNTAGECGRNPNTDLVQLSNVAMQKAVYISCTHCTYVHLHTADMVILVRYVG